MSINLNDNINVSAPLPIDSRYGNGSSLPFTAYTSTTTANTATAGKRYIGLTVIVGTPPVEYWYKDGIADANLVPKYYNVVTSNTSITTSVFANSSTNYTQSYLDGVGNFIEAGSYPTTPVGTVTGSKSRLVASKKAAIMWTNDYSSYAYEAQTRYLNAHPWLGSIDSSHTFQIFDGVAFSNANGAYLARYYDERANAENWQDTYNNKSSLTAGKTYTLVAYKSGDDFTGIVYTAVSGTINTTGWKFTYTSGTPTTWTNNSILSDSDGNRLSGANTLINAKVYTLTSLAGGDDFTNGLGTTISGSPTTPPWVFTSNGTQPATWTNGSVVEGDYPYIPEDQKASRFVAEVATSGTFSGKGVLSARANSLDVYGMLNQANATRGTVLASMTTTQRGTNIPTPIKGEMIFNITTNTLNYYNGTTWVSV
jgi:hypothetical protein